MNDVTWLPLYLSLASLVLQAIVFVVVGVWHASKIGTQTEVLSATIASQKESNAKLEKAVSQLTEKYNDMAQRLVRVEAYCLSEGRDRMPPRNRRGGS